MIPISHLPLAATFPTLTAGGGLFAGKTSKGGEARSQAFGADQMDRMVEPRAEIARYAAHGWYVRTQVPADMARWGATNPLIPRFGGVSDNASKARTSHRRISFTHDLTCPARPARPQVTTRLIGNEPCPASPFVSLDPGSGKASAALHHTGDCDWSFTLGKPMTVTPGDIYDFSASIQVEGPGSVTLCAILYDAQNNAIAWTLATSRTA